MFASDEKDLIQALHSGDEAAFLSLVDRYHASLVRIGMLYVSEHSIAEEVAQEAWLAVLLGLDRFEGRSSLKTWIYRILTNIAKTRGKRERRQIPFSALEDPELEIDEPAVKPVRFLPAGHPRWPHHWSDPPQPWGHSLEERMLSKEVLACIEGAIQALPPNQRAVITLRDIEGLSSEEVCNIFDLSETNQRVLLHRARSKVRSALEAYFNETPERV